MEKRILNFTIYYDEKYNQIITTSDTKVANIAIDEKEMIINGTSESMMNAILKINDNIYLPIEEMENVYNIEVSYICNCCKGKQQTAGGYHWKYVVGE